MEEFTRRLWSEQDRHSGDRKRLFNAVRAAAGGCNVLYPGSFVDIAPSFVYPTVTYVDSDKRTPRFFGDEDGVREIIISERGPSTSTVEFIHADYHGDLGLPEESLYAEPVSEHCTRYLRVGGVLLVSTSHGDVAMASMDSRYEIAGVVTSGSGEQGRLSRHLLDTKEAGRPQS